MRRVLRQERLPFAIAQADGFRGLRAGRVLAHQAAVTGHVAAARIAASLRWVRSSAMGRFFADARVGERV